MLMGVALPDLIVSLGPNCKTAWNLRDYFSLDTAYPFDWWITPIRTTLEMIRPDFVFNVEADDLAIIPDGATNTVHNRKLNLLHHHDFSRVNGLVERLAPAEIEQINSKYRHLFARLHENVAAAKEPLIVLGGLHPGWKPGEVQHERAPDAQGNIPAQDVINSIRQALGNHVRVAIIDIAQPKTEELDGGVRIALPDTGQREGRPPAMNWTEPSHVFRQAFATLI